MHVLVTGGHGFVGSHLVRRLLAAADRVRVLLRRPVLPASLVGLDVDVVRGDVRDPAALCRALEGVHEVHHLAALTRSRTVREMFATNVDATARLLEAARRARLPGRFVFCSSLAALGPSPDGHALEEDAPCRPVTWYGQSKRAAEARVRAAAGELAVTILRPPAVYGPWDRDFLAVFRAASRGVLPLLGEGGRTYSFVYAADLADAFAVVARHPATAGGTFHVTHAEPLGVRTFLDRVARAVGRRARPVRVPDSALRLAATASETLSQLASRPFLLNRQRLRELEGRAYVLSGDALARAVGWRAPTATGPGTAATAAWYREHGWLR